MHTQEQAQEKDVEDILQREHILPICAPGFLMNVSRQGGGKSHLDRYLMYENQRNFPWGVVFSKTVFDEENIPYIPLQYKHLGYQRDVLIGLMRLQLSYPKEIRPTGFIIFDDCITGTMWNDEVLQDAFTQMRHYHFFIIVCTQYLNKVPPIIREQASDVALFHMETKRSMDAAFESYGGDFEDIKDFRRFIVGLGKGTHKFAYQNKFVSDKWFVCRAPAEIPPFMMNMPPLPEQEPKKPKKHKKRKRDSF